MHNLWLIMLAKNTIFIDKVINLSKLHVKFQPHPLDSLRKGGKSEKTHESCIIRLVHPS